MHDEATATFCHLPAGQSAHALDPAVAENWPAAQSAHVAVTALFCAVGPKRPATHSVPVHDEAAIAFCHFPAGHAAQAPAPGSALNRPAAQSAHVALAALICATGPWRPAAHGVPVHGWYPLLECVPATQGAGLV